MRYIARLQETLASLGYDPGPIDDDFGSKTATTYIKALREGAIEHDHPHVVEARQQVAARVPRQRDILAAVDGWLVDDPTRPGYGTWRSEAGRATAKAYLRTFDVPLLGKLILDRRAAGPIIAAWGEVEHLTEYRPGRASSMCYRRMDRNPSRPWSTHCTGYAIDVDLDGDGKWERVEDAIPQRVIDILESWGLVLGLHWQGKARDDMHTQWTE